MDALRIGGIVSGMDTNSIIDKLVAQAKIPLQNLQSQYDLKTLEKKVYTGISDDLKTMKTDLLNLRLESTYKNYTTTSSNPAIVSATATPTADVGSHVIKVTQTAKNAYSYSQYTRASVTINDVGVTATSGRPTDFNEGVHNVTISDNNGTYILEDSFKFNELGSLTKYSGSTPINVVDDYGKFTGSASGTLELKIDGSNYSVDISYNTGDDINKVTNQIEQSINSQLNIKYNTSNIQYFSVRADYDSSSKKWNLAFYNTSTKNLSFSVTGGSLQSDLGLATTPASTISDMKKYLVANSLNNLQTKMNDTTGGLIPGVTFTAANLTTGTMTIAQDASLKVSAPTYTTIYSADPSSSTSINTTVIGLQNAGFSTAPSSSTNGTFTINGKKITIDDYTAISVNDLLAKINSSGAGVVASYNATTDQFELRSTTKGATTITLGDYSDTSNILSILKLTTASGAQTVIGKTAGSIDPTAVLNQAGLTSSPTSGIFTINGVSIYVDVTKDSLNDVISKVNNSGSGVTMSYDEVRDKITVSSTSGVDKIEFGSSSDTSNLLSALNLTDTPTVAKKIGYAGQYAILNVDGIDYVRSTNKINDIIKGVTLNVKSASTEPVAIDITTDPSKAVNALATFVQHYNQLVEKLSPPKLTDEDKQYLTELTDDKKKSMSSDDIKSYQEKWTTFNTYEIIRRSSELRQLKNSLRENLFNDLSGINGKYNNLSDIGLQIAGDGDLEILKKGYLVTDSTDLDTIKSALNANSTLIDALTNNPNDVYQLFSQNTSAGKGWSNTFTDKINSYVAVDGLIYNKIKTAGSIDQQLYTLAQNIDRQTTRVNDYFERLWKSFSNMESRIAELQDQGNALSGITANSTSK